MGQKTYRWINAHCANWTGSCHRKGVVLVLHHGVYGINPNAGLTARIHEAGYERADFKAVSGPYFGVRDWIKRYGRPAAIIRWEEAGGRFGELRK